MRNILSMAKAMDMKTVAEGVDEEGLVGQLRNMGMTTALRLQFEVN